MSNLKQIVPLEVIERKIYLIRGQKVMLDSDLAMLYEVETGALNQAVKRNKGRSPADFMFRLSDVEFKNWISQIVISNPAAKKGFRKRPYVFTEQGIAMLSSVLKSERAVRVNIAIVRTFVRLRYLLATHKDLAEKLREMEKKYDHRFRVVFFAIRKLMTPKEEPRKNDKPFGFRGGGR